MWQFSSQLDASPGQGICSPKRQSTCELEGDAIVEEILNQQFKLYSSLSQTHSDVKMVRSLIPIWEEEFERTGMHEVAMPPDPGKPLPEDVLRSLSHGLEFENKLGELCNQAGDSLAFTPLEKDERFMQSITSSADERNLVGDVLVSPNDNDGEPSKCFKDQNKNISPVSQGSLCEEDDDAIPSEGRGMCLQQLSVDERQRSENIGPSGLKVADNEALGLLSWLASSQAAEDINSDDELVCQTILSPLLPTVTIDKVLEKANMDYENESQQECQDILDSVEDLADFKGLKERASCSTDHSHSPQTSLEKMIPQVDGSGDDPNDCSGNSSETEMKSETKRFSQHQVLQDTGASFSNKHKRNQSLWGSLPLTTTQKVNDNLKSVSLNMAKKDASEVKDGADKSFLARNEEEKCCEALCNVRTDVNDLKEASTLVGCSMRDLMRRKRCHRVEPSECVIHTKKVLSEKELKDVSFLHPKQFHALQDNGHHMRPSQSPNFWPSSTHQQIDFQEACDFNSDYSACSMYGKLPSFSSTDGSLLINISKDVQFDHCGRRDDEVGTEATAGSRNFTITGHSQMNTGTKELLQPFNTVVRDSAASMVDFEFSNCKEYACKPDPSTDVQFLKFDTGDKHFVDERLKQTKASASSCLSNSPFEHEMVCRDGYTCRSGRDCRTSIECLPEISSENLEGWDGATGTTLSQFKNCGGGDWGNDAGLSGTHNLVSTVVNMEAKPVELIGMTFHQKPPTVDWTDGTFDNALLSPAIPNCSSLENEESCKGKSVQGTILDEFIPFFVGDCQEEKKVWNKCYNDLNNHQEVGMGVPTHYQNDGSFLYLLTPVFSPPSADCVHRWLLHDDTDTSAEPLPVGSVSHVKPVLDQQNHEIHDNLNAKKNAFHDKVPEKTQVKGNIMKVKKCTNCSQDISQISGPEEKSKPTPLSQIGFRDPASVGGGQQVTLLSIEIQAESRGDLRPDPRYDAINVIVLVIQEDDDSALEVFVLCRSNIEPCQRKLDGISGCKVLVSSEEKLLFDNFINIICSFDPDILIGWDIQGGSLGFLAERASHLGIGLLNKISRTPSETKTASRNFEIPEKRVADEMLPENLVDDSVLLEEAIIEDEWGRTHASGVHVGGRIVLNVWRLMRGEIKLNMYTAESVAEAVLRQKIPSIRNRVLTKWFSSGPGRARYRSIEYVIRRAKLNFEIMNQLDMINRTSELARVFGIDFFSVLSRGSQYRVESMFLRLAHTQNFLAISPGPQQVATQPAMECLPLVMEPESGFYADPVVVLDFQSLYPSMIIAYNLCYSTCLGKVAPSKADVLGVSIYSPDPHALHDLKDQILLTPNGVMYVPSKARKGVLPRLLEEILSTRIMVKKAMKKLVPSQQVLQRIFNARQLALKLIANVTYGYTAAGYSGRMPCAELADSIVQCGRRTLENAISLVNTHDKWKAKVIYGDTDSMFVLLKGRTVKESFQIGHEIASAVTAMNPNPVTLKMEKVYHPCFLLTKKRYVGYSYESPDQIEPTFDAKGIETVRRDTCGAVAKTMEQSLRLFFEHQDISKVKVYLQRQWKRILSGRVSLQDFVFAKEVRLGTYSSRASSLPPAAIVAIKAMRADPRAEPCYAERVPYVVIHGEPGARLVDLVVEPLDLLAIDSPYRLNDQYYINKQIIPALQRVFGLVGADLYQWFSEMPRPVREVYAKHKSHAPNPYRTRIDFYYLSKHCILCGELSPASAHICDKCSKDGTAVAAAVIGRTAKLERDIQHLAAICRHCGGGDWIMESGVKCTSLACSVFYERRKVQKDLQGLSSVATEAGFYPKCMVEWF